MLLYSKISCLLICIGVMFLSSTLIGEERRHAHYLQNAYANVAEKALPAVVVVLNVRYDPWGKLQNYAHGSGFFVREDGILVTNYHVVEGADVLGIRLLNDQVFPATLVGTSKDTDLAVLKAEVGKKVPFLKFADTSTVKIGHYTIAIGAPLSLSHTMTTGVVSFKGRKLGLNYKEDFIQTDASINPGNSGGPLLNIDGLVIGVNDCGLMPGGNGSIGLNFAIDGNLVQRTLGTLLSRGLKQRPVFGVTVEETKPEGQGVLITKVSKGSPADEAELQEGDIITRLGKTQITDLLQFQFVFLSEYKPGDKTILDIQRLNKTKHINIVFQ